MSKTPSGRAVVTRWAGVALLVGLCSMLALAVPVLLQTGTTRVLAQGPPIDPPGRPLGPPQVEETFPLEQRVVPPKEETEGDFVAKAVPQEPPGPHILVPVPPEEYARLKREARTKPTAVRGQSLPVVRTEGTVEALSVLNSYAGLNLLSSVNNASPPDTILAKSGFRVLQAVNRSLRLHRPFGAVLDTEDLNVFFGASTTEGLLFDPKAYFDRLGANFRLYVVALQRCNPQSAFGSDRCPSPASTRLSKIWLAVSRAPNPNNLDPASWCRYEIDSLQNRGTGDESWADYPGLGGGKDALVVSANNFRWARSYDRAYVYAIDKEPLANNAGSCPTLSYSLFPATTSTDDFGFFTLQPADHTTAPSSGSGTTNPAYLVSTEFGQSNVYHVWRVKNVATTPSLERVSLSTGLTYDIAPQSTQNGSSPLLDTGGPRTTQVSARGDQVWAVHGTLCNVGGGANESCIAMAQFDVSPGGGAWATLRQLFTIGGDNGDFYYWPGIAIDSSRNQGMLFQYSGSSDYLSAAYIIQPYLLKVLVLPTTLIGGTCRHPTVGRTGDYVGAQVNPNDLASFWFSAEANQLLSGSCNWVTQIQQIAP